jgi:hypothetical protein
VFLAQKEKQMIRFMSNISMGTVVAIWSTAAFGEWDFNYGYRHVNQANSDDYIIEVNDLRKYSEWQNPPITYWGPTVNDVEEIQDTWSPAEAQRWAGVYVHRPVEVDVVEVAEHYHLGFD